MTAHSHPPRRPPFFLFMSRFRSRLMDWRGDRPPPPSSVSKKTQKTTIGSRFVCESIRSMPPSFPNQSLTYPLANASGFVRTDGLARRLVHGLVNLSVSLYIYNLLFRFCLNQWLHTLIPHAAPFNRVFVLGFIRTHGLARRLLHGLFPLTRRKSPIRRIYGRRVKRAMDVLQRRPLWYT